VPAGPAFGAAPASTGDVVAVMIKGRAVVLMMSDDRAMARPANHGIIHDPTGQDLPRCDVFVGPFHRGRGVAMLDQYGKQYYGRRYNATDAEVDMPLGPWRPAGQARAILYQRDKGVYASERPYRHVFKHLVDVERCGSMVRLRLGDGCLLSWRGFIKP
jgi:hypothetical protein